MHPKYHIYIYLALSSLRKGEALENSEISDGYVKFEEVI